MAQRQSGFTRASALGPIADFMEGRGASVVRVFEDVDLPVSLLDSPETLLPLREQFRLLERAARATGDANFGASLGRDVRVRNLSAFGKWVAEAPSLGETIDRAARGLNAMLQTSTVLTLSRKGEIAEWSIEFLDPECTGRYQNELLGLSYLIDGVRCHAGRSWKPDLVMTTAARGTPSAALEQILGANVSTGHSVPTIRFDARLLDGTYDPAAKADSGCHPLPDEPPLPAHEDELATIAAVTALALCETYPRIDWVAAKLAMTRRSLQRRLAEHGTTFGQLVEDELTRRSLALLARTSHSVTAIALQLGYADGAHFTRAFKRWSGMTPSAYRANCQPNGTGS